MIYPLTFSLSLLALAATESVPAIPCSHRVDLEGEVDARVDAALDGLLDVFRDLHAHPELSRHETETAAKVAASLRADGYEVTTGVGGTGVVGVLKNGAGPTVLLRGDMDALPLTEDTDLPYKSEVIATRDDGTSVGVMHACGHDMHTTCLIGAAGLLAGIRDRWTGTIVAIAQPAEEIGAGAREMIGDGLFDRFPRPDYCLSLHVSAGDPAGHIGYTKGYALANVDSVDVRIFGAGGHGSQPHQAIDPVVAASHVVVALQTVVSRRLDPLEPGVITVGSIHAGTKHNIIPDEAVMQITVRSYTDASRAVLLDGIRTVAVNTCRALGCVRDPEVHVREEEHTPATYNDPALVEASVAVLSQIMPAEHLHEQPPVMGGEDFGRYPKFLGVPGFMMRLGAVGDASWQESRRDGGAPLPSLHSGRFQIDPRPTLREGLRGLTTLSLALLGRE